MISRASLASILLTLTTAGGASAQFADWTTSGFDAQRSNWLRSDTKISLESMQKPGFAAVWKSKVIQGNPQQRLMPPVLLDFYISYRGFRSLAFIGSSGNSVTAFDADLGREEWKNDFKVEGSAATAPSPLCPGGMTAGLARPSLVGYAPMAARGGTGRGNPAKSGVGEPYEGAVTIRREAARPAAPPKPPPTNVAAAGPVRRMAVAESPYAPRVQLVHAIASDGKLHSMYVSNGEEPKPAAQFLAPNSYAKGLLVLNNAVYTATANACGGTENGMWALDLPSQKVNHWKSDASPVGFAAGPDGTIYATAGGELAFLEERTLARKNGYKIGSQAFTSSPLVMDFNSKDLIAVASNDGKLHIIDSASPDKALATSAPFFASEAPVGALASWVDFSNVRWILAATAGAPVAGSGLIASNGAITNGSIVAWKLAEAGGTTTLQPGWVSRDMVSPLPPIVVNGVIFALSSGEYRPGDAKVAAAERSRRSTPAVLYALDSATGKELWNSGKEITSYVNAGGLTAGGSRVYVAAQDGTQYVFGFPIEH